MKQNKMGNNKVTQKRTFWEFLSEHSIEIPIIQRDYAQGRVGKEYLRERFLDDMKKALDDKSPKMKLDFVYGVYEHNTLNPLDGQQRLTTLWLLHWYIAYKAGELNGDNQKLFQRFTYETRVSSREFCKQLSMFTKDNGDKNISEHIQAQTWFFSAWKQDPSVQSMLRMLSGTPNKDKSGNEIRDGIEELFKDCAEVKFKEYWTKLTDTGKCPILFYYRDLHELKQPDDLYIKMNARGKQLTDFENFKADLIRHIEDKNWRDLLDPESGIPIKMDTAWTDIFWENNKDGKIDEIYFAFINRFLLNALVAVKKNDNKFVHSAEGLSNLPIFRYIYGKESDDTGIKYTSFSHYSTIIDYKTIKSLELTLDNISKDCKLNNDIKNSFPRWCNNKNDKNDKNDKLEFIPIYDNDKNNKISILTQKQRVVFYGVCKFYELYSSENDNFEKPFKRWMRVVWNIVENSTINSIATFISTLRLIDELVTKLKEKEYKYDIYKLLVSDYQIISDANSEQVKEEREKARQILCPGKTNYPIANNEEDREKMIIDAESYAFFNGAIRFLFRDGNEDYDWRNFEKKWGNAQSYFNSKGEENKDEDKYHGVVNKEYNGDGALLLKAVISRFTENNYSEVLAYNKKRFNNQAETWKYYLTRDEIFNPVHEILMYEDFRHLSEDGIVKKRENPTDFGICKILWQLTQTNLLDFVVKHIPNSWIRFYHGHTAIYPSSTGVFLNAEKRDKFLLCNSDIEVAEKHKVPDTNFLFGSDINFKYNNNNFQWKRNNYIYLIDSQSPNSYVERDRKNGKSEEENYFCFKVSYEYDCNNDYLKEKLNALIKTYKQREIQEQE